MKKFCKKLFQFPAVIFTVLTVICCIMMFLDLNDFSVWVIGGLFSAIMTGLSMKLNGNNHH